MPATSAPTLRAVDLCSAGKPGEVLPVNIAAAKACNAAQPVAGIDVLPLIEAAGRVTAKPITARSNLPPFDNSAMDGYAVSASDFSGDGPWQLAVTGRIAAGDYPPEAVRPRNATQIFTGAPVPKGADTVVMQEACERTGNFLKVTARPLHGKNIRWAGEDVASGAIIAEAGILLTPPRLALIAATELSEVAVTRRIRIGLISTGSELIEPGETRATGMIYNSNRYFLRATLNRPWIETRDFGIVSDNAAAISSVVREAAQQCDVLITTGGVSASEEDHMLDVLAQENADLDILKVAMRPGKPVTVGKIGSTLYFGLPGNPYATAITFAQISWPAIQVAAGLRSVLPDWIAAVSGFHYRRRAGRTEYVPVTWNVRDDYGRPIVQMLGKGSSASLSPMAMAKAIAILPPEMETVEIGAALRIDPLCE